MVEKDDVRVEQELVTHGGHCRELCQPSSRISLSRDSTLCRRARAGSTPSLKTRRRKSAARSLLPVEAAGRPTRPVDCLRVAFPAGRPTFFRLADLPPC